jgi:DNA-binding LytR/AlgR family response regulator
MIGIVILNWTTNLEVLWKQITSVITYGSVVIFISIAFSLGLPEIFPKVFDSERWTVLKTITFILLAIITIGVAITLIAFHIDNPNGVNFFIYFINVLIRAITLSFFPIILLVFYLERILHKKNHLVALEIINEINKDRPAKQEQVKNTTFIFAENTKDEIKIPENDLLYVKAEGNYCNLVYKNNSILHRKLVRCSMKDAELSIIKSDNFIRCHKSFIINITQISNITGNARGYLFYLIDHDYKVPCSRNLSRSLISKIKAAQNS